MLVEQYPYINEQGTEYPNLIRHYSDKEMMILQVETGAKYADAIDLYPCRYTYEETNEPIEPIEETE